jgi:DNA-binding PadR family transcriptional regulator
MDGAIRMAKRAVSNPLALAVLACVYERPMHPYEMATTMRERGKEQSIKLNYGEGRRPERTVYRITEAGRAELGDWMSELLAVPVKEYPQFEAALSLLPVLPPDQVLTLLRRRMTALAKEIAGTRALLEASSKGGLPRLLLIEGEYHLKTVETELAWVRELVAELAEGTFEGLDIWRRAHETGEWPELSLDFSVMDAHLGRGQEGGATQA